MKIVKNIMSIVVALFSLAAAAQPYVAFVENGKYGLNSNKGAPLLEPRYGYINTKTIYGDKVLVRVADSCFLVNIKTKESSLLSAQPRAPKQSLTPAMVAVNDKYGYIDSAGRVIIDGRWDFADDFYDGMARVVNYNGVPFSDAPTHYPSPGKTAFIDTLGNYIIQPTHSYVDRFADGVARFTDGQYICADQFGCENPYQGRKWGLIDKSGKIILSDNKYDFIDAAAFDANNNRIVFGVMVGDKKGYIDTAGRLLTPMVKANSFQAVYFELKIKN